VKNENRKVRESKRRTKQKRGGGSQNIKELAHVKRGCEFKYSVGMPGVSSEHLPPRHQSPAEKPPSG